MRRYLFLGLSILVLVLILVLIFISSKKVEPLLTTKWKQGGDFAKFEPNKDRLGCWSTAFAQILYYHRKSPSGTQRYTCKNGSDIYEDFSTHTFDFSIFVDEFNDTTPMDSIDEVARYCYFCAVVIQKDFFPPDYGYMIYGEQRAEEVQEHYGVLTKYYKPGQGIPRNDPMIKDLIQNELKARRPMMLYLESKPDDEGKKAGHAVVIDGYHLDKGKFLVHLNMGWGGKDDGWYDFYQSILIFDNTEFYFLVTINPTIPSQ